jgi:hypothetical protein
MAENYITNKQSLCTKRLSKDIGFARFLDNPNRTGNQSFENPFIWLFIEEFSIWVSVGNPNLGCIRANRSLSFFWKTLWSRKIFDWGSRVSLSHIGIH